MNEIKSSTGGIIIITPGVTYHKAAEGAYSGRIAELGVECKIYDAPKRGRGRPKKVSQLGVPYDFSAFITPVKIPKWTGPVFRNINSVN